MGSVTVCLTVCKWSTLRSSIYSSHSIINRTCITYSHGIFLYGEAMGGSLHLELLVHYLCNVHHFTVKCLWISIKISANSIHPCSTPPRYESPSTGPEIYFSLPSQVGDTGVKIELRLGFPTFRANISFSALLMYLSRVLQARTLL